MDVLRALIFLRVALGDSRQSNGGISVTFANQCLVQEALDCWVEGKSWQNCCAKANDILTSDCYNTRQCIRSKCQECQGGFQSTRDSILCQRCREYSQSVKDGRTPYDEEIVVTDHCTKIPEVFECDAQDWRQCCNYYHVNGRPQDTMNCVACLMDTCKGCKPFTDPNEELSPMCQRCQDWQRNFMMLDKTTRPDPENAKDAFAMSMAPTFVMKNEETGGGLVAKLGKGAEARGAVDPMAKGKGKGKGKGKRAKSTTKSSSNWH